MCRDCNKFKGYELSDTPKGKTFGDKFCSGSDPGKGPERCAEYSTGKIESKEGNKNEGHKESS